MCGFQEDRISISLHEPNVQEKLFFLLSGVIISVPFTLFIASFTDSLCLVLPLFYAQVCSIAIFTPFIEEFAKAYPLFYRHGETKKSLFTLGFIVGLGFGLSEFLLYVSVLNVSWFVRLPGLFFHAASTSITAYGIATEKPITYYLFSVFLHFLINFSALFTSVWYLIAPITLSIAFALSYNLYKKSTTRIYD